MASKFHVYLRIYWLRILAVTVIALLIVSLVWIMVVGFQALVSMDSIFRRSTMASVAIQTYVGIITSFIFAAVYIGLHYWFMFGGGMTKMGAKKAKPESVNVKWADVVGMETVKKEVWEVIKLIKDRAELKKTGGRIIKGVMLVGPPGCGKTYLAKAVATETKLPFLHAVSSEFVGILVGLGAQKIRTLFQEARALGDIHGGCIVFIDEIDSIARPRGADQGFGGVMSHNATVNQLLSDMDGLASTETNIVVMAATNVPEGELDSALMRAGRFDRKIYVGLPGLKEREQIISYYLQKISYDKDRVDLSKLARLTVGNSPADIANITREAALISVRKSKNKVDMDDIHEAKERITLGIKAEIVLSAQDKKIAAYHEAGHTIIAYLLVPSQDVFKASIIPRRTMGGSTWIAEKEESFLPNKQDLLGKIKISLAGYAAEKIKYGTTSTNVEDDLKKANELAEKMVSEWGMGTSGPSGVTKNPWQRRDVVDRDKEDIIMTCLNEISEILRKEKVILDEIAQQLIEREELDYDTLTDIFKKHKKTRLTYILEGIRKEKNEGVIGWNDIIGMEQAKEEAKEVVQLIKDRVTLKQIGGQIIKGLLLFGPPGCGKTYLASAIANEAGVPFIAKSGSEFVEMFVGVGASRIRHLFQEAREQALTKGGCIIFIDEMDALCAKRSLDQGFGGTSEHNQTLNQFLVEMDGLKEKDVQYNIVIIGATNTDEQYLDAAVVRPGRFDRKIYVELPTLEERKKIFDYYLAKIQYNRAEIDSEKFAGITPGWSPADISNLIREAALLAVRNKKAAAGLKEMDDARERIELGLKRKLKMTKEELTATAYHEAGHCVANYFFLKGGFPFKLSIVPRRKSAGVAWYAVSDDSVSGDKNMLLARIKIALAGYVAERTKYGVGSWGVSSDFKAAMRTAHAMVWQLGMGESGLIGDFYSLCERNGAFLSEEMKAKLDRETQSLLQGCLRETEQLIGEQAELFEQLAAELLAKEELNYSEIEEIFKKHAKPHPQKASG